MASLLLVTEDHGFATAAEALSNADLTVTRAHAEEAVAVARHDLPDVLAIDTDSIVEAKPLIVSNPMVGWNTNASDAPFCVTVLSPTRLIMSALPVTEACALVI